MNNKYRVQTDVYGHDQAQLLADLIQTMLGKDAEVYIVPIEDDQD